MYLSRVQITNFRNFKHIDLPLKGNAVILGENRVGKSNFLFALRLVLDSSLPDSARQLKLTDVWDGHDPEEEPSIEIHLDFADFDNDQGLTALLTDYRLPTDHTTARLSYIYRKRGEITGAPTSEADFEFKIYGAGDISRNVNPYLRRRICLALLPALRDAETELGLWRTSPLRPLLNDAISKIPKDRLEAVAEDITSATGQITALEPIQKLEEALKNKMATLSGLTQDIQTKLGIVPSDPSRLFHSIRLLIDNGKRGISEASLGSANLALLTLKLAEFEWQRQKNDHNFTLMCVEEPEAHLHPHLQRSVYKKLFEEIKGQPLSLFLTTHSPNLASVTPLPSIVVLREDMKNGSCAYSLANLALTAREMEDLQRYLDVSRAEILFSRAIIFVEGDAEETLIPVFAQTLGINLDELGITVCNVGGVNFTPYVRLANALSLPFCVITDWDPQSGTSALGINRLLDLIDITRSIKGKNILTATERTALSTNVPELKKTGSDSGLFTNSSTLETEIADTAELNTLLLDVLESGEFGAKRQARIASWKNGTIPVDGEQLLGMIADIGKGRFAARLAAKSINVPPPAYIKSALEYIKKYG